MNPLMNLKIHSKSNPSHLKKRLSQEGKRRGTVVDGGEEDDGGGRCRRCEKS